LSRKKYPRIKDFSEIGKRIRLIRGAVTQDAFADIFGVNQNTVSRWEKGAVLSDEETLEKIAAYGGVTSKWLLHGDLEAPAGEIVACKIHAQLSEHAPDLYEVRPRELNLNYLTRALLLARQFCRAARPRLPEAGEAELASYLYEYWQETGLKPDQVVVKRYAALIKQQED
jgi:transcriptional regulator with XRE-family HTH domain